MIHFGTGGWRAFIGEEFTKANVERVSQALANMIKEQGQQDKGFVVGFDRRFLSDKASKWMAQVVAANGIKVYFVKKYAPTPMIMFAAKQLKTALSACITASHNPADYNGVKVFALGGRDANEIETQQVELLANQLTADDVQTIDFDEAVAQGLIELFDPTNDFIDSIINAIDMEAIKNSHLKVLLDPMHGVSKTCLQTVLISARCDLDVINDRHDTLFGGKLPSPSAHTLSRLTEMVVEQGYDIGIGTDGDADRLGIIDEKGNFIHPNEILALLYYYMLKYKGWKGSVVRNVATTHLLDKIAASFGEQCYEVPVGFKHISAKMEEQDSLIGGESSGGLTIRGHIKGKDGIFAASLLVELMSVSGKKLSELLSEIYHEYGYCYTAEGDCTFKAADKPRLYTKIYTDKALPEFKYEIDKVSYADGAKVYFKNGGWIIARFSGTEPLLRIFAEMDCKERAEEVLNQMKDFLQI
ncbi:MAG: phosphoglucomutase/phosphomannomutase family protein [Plesiomonas sp.]|uniref:phosphoglucomutase/phosphomannomutase family protein n=1 Tax=Plesiomonas sp. TaxID=2486279 RepID=UPI003F3AF86B